MAALSDEPIKARIMSHMNKDHQDSLSRFLEAYAGISHYTARSPKLEDLTLSNLTIRSAAGRNIIPISPPMASLSEARTRMVEMHQDCGRILGRDSITVKNFRWPGLLHSSIIIGVLLGLVSFANGSNFAPGSFLAHTLFYPVPELARFMERHHWYVWWAILIVHVAEAGLMTVWLKKYNVPPFSRLWMLYVGFTALEGYGCGARLKDEVARERALKQRKDEKEGSH